MVCSHMVIPEPHSNKKLGRVGSSYGGSIPLCALMKLTDFKIGLIKIVAVSTIIVSAFFAYNALALDEQTTFSASASHNSDIVANQVLGPGDGSTISALKIKVDNNLSPISIFFCEYVSLNQSQLCGAGTGGESGRVQISSVSADSSGFYTFNFSGGTAIGTLTAGPNVLDVTKFYTLGVRYSAGSSNVYGSAANAYDAGFAVGGNASTGNTTTTLTGLADLYFEFPGQVLASSTMTLTYPIDTATTTPFTDFAFDYANVNYPFYIVYIAYGTDPTQLPLKTGNDSETAAGGDGSGFIGVGNIGSNLVPGNTYYARGIMWGKSTSTVGPLPPVSEAIALSQVISFEVVDGPLFVTTTSTIITAGGGTNLFPPEDCSAYPAVQTYIGIPFLAPSIFARIGCETKGLANEFLGLVMGYGTDTLAALYNGFVHVWPINMFDSLNNALDQAEASSTVPMDIVITGTDRILVGRTFVILNASTTAWIQDEADFDYKAWMSRIAYGATALFMISAIVGIVRRMHHQSQGT